MNRALKANEAEFLSTLIAGRDDRRLALAVVLTSAVFFFALAPFAKTPLAAVPAFIPIYESTLVINDLITAAMLYGQFSILRSRALLVLASGYVFTALMTIAHALTFPGLFSPTGLLGAGPQSTAWLYALWHAGFPICVAGYALLDGAVHETRRPQLGSARDILLGIAAAAGAAISLALLATAGHALLPPILLNNRYTLPGSGILGSDWVISLVALVVLWRRQKRSVLDIWLMAVMCAWLFDIALSAVLNAGRFDVGWYAGRIYGMLAASFILLVLLLENSRLYVRLLTAHAGALSDIQERERLADELTKARAIAEQANHAKANFLAAMSHEIRTPMNGVIGMIDVLHQSSLKGYQVEMVDLIRESAFSLLAIIDDILDFSKIEAGRLEIESAPTRIAEVTEKVCGLLDNLASKKGVELTVFVDPAIPHEVMGDSLRLRQVLINLANNAIKFSSGQERPGKVSVRARLACAASDSVTVEFLIKDNGIGMTDETRSSLFAPFVQADVSTTRRFGGTGLGLAISGNLAMLMGGAISVTSAVGEGSTFALTMSFKRNNGSSEVRDMQSDVAGLQCLVVGASGGLADAIAAYLRADGATVETVGNLQQIATQAAAPKSGQWLWIVDSEGSAMTPVDLRLAAQPWTENEELDIRFVLIGRGSARYPRLECLDCVKIDGNVLGRKALSKAVAIAAGRVREELDMPHTGRAESAFSPLPRAEVLRQGRLILVAEDNETNQKVILRQLALLGYAADVADDGIQALQLWRSGNYAMLLTDVHMPKMDGYHLSEVIRAEENGARHAPIIALTANALKGEVERCNAAGMDMYLCKPVQLDELKTALEALLSSTAPTPHAMAAAAPRIPATEGEQSVDVRILKNLIGDNDAVISEFLSDFQINANKIAQELTTACAEKNAALACAQAHKLKSSARAVGALALGDLCAEIETAGKAENMGRLEELLPLFKVELGAVNNFLETLPA